MLRVAALLCFVTGCGTTFSVDPTFDSSSEPAAGDGADPSGSANGADGDLAGAPESGTAPGTGSSAATDTDAGSVSGTDAGMAHGDFALTSTAFEDGAIIPEGHTCNGSDLSPPLAFRHVPTGTASFALIFTDLDAMIPGDDHPFIHWALWDIPGDLTALDEGIPDGANPTYPAGSSQVRGWSALGGAIGGSKYLGPCPREPHDYEFALYALSVAKLEGVSTNQQPAEILRAVEASSAVLGKATLTGHYDPP